MKKKRTVLILDEHFLEVRKDAPITDLREGVLYLYIDGEKIDLDSKRGATLLHEAMEKLESYLMILM